MQVTLPDMQFSSARAYTASTTPPLPAVASSTPEPRVTGALLAKTSGYTLAQLTKCIPALHHYALSSHGRALHRCRNFYKGGAGCKHIILEAHLGLPLQPERRAISHSNFPGMQPLLEAAGL